eukprot:scaffold125091_cov53-Attheya_sp.AAC.1
MRESSRTQRNRVSLLVSSLALFAVVALCPSRNGLVDAGKMVHMSREEVNQLVAETRERYIRLNEKGTDEVSNTDQAVALRNYQLRKKKMKGVIRKKEVTPAQVLIFPGVSPEEYDLNEEVPIFAELVESKKTQVPFEYYDLPVCSIPPFAKKYHKRKNLGSKLQGRDPKPSPFPVSVGNDVGCTPICEVNIGGTQIRWMRKLVDRQYRVHLTLDQLPVLMRISKELNYAVGGYPLGFKAPPSYTKLKNDEYFLYNHLQFTITYKEDSDFEGVRITGFDVNPVSVDHNIKGDLNSNSVVATCNADASDEAVTHPKSFLALRSGPTGEPLSVIYSYEVAWEKSDLEWADRWDVYLIGSPGDDIRYFAILNSLMILLVLTGLVAIIMIRTLRKDMQTLEEAQEGTGWKMLHGDVFRPPSFSPMLLSVCVGTGVQIGAAFVLTMLCTIAKLVNPMKKGQTLTAVIVLYVLSGSVSGYVSSRIYKFCDAKAWKRNTLATAAAFPGVLVAMFLFLDFFLAFAGAATSVSFFTIIALFLLWICVSTPLVFVGSYLGFRVEKFYVPTKTNQIARFVPEKNVWYATPAVWFLLGGILSFASVQIELLFIMNALWLHEIYYVMGFQLIVLMFLAATCAEMSLVICYLQLCVEDHRWWWKSFFNCASAGVYLFLYSLWFLYTKLELVGLLPVAVYLTYMSMISLAFSLFCGSVGFLSAFMFNQLIYGALKVD